MMFTGTYEIAGHAVKIRSLFGEVQHLCRNYESDLCPEFEISTCPDDIDQERRVSQETAALEGCQFPDYQDSYLETLAVYRKLCARLIEHDILLVHGSCVSIDGNGCLFVARSGTGKSTHTRNWRKVFGGRVMMVNDDKPLLSVRDMQIYGTPWDGKHHLSTNTSVPLRAVAILKRGLENRIRPAAPAEALDCMMGQVYMPPGSMMRVRAIALLGRAIEKAGFYVLECNMDPSSASTAYEGMPELKK